MLLEYAAGGSLVDRIQSYTRGLPKTEVRRYTNSVLLGLSYIHKKGYIHYNIKPQNILLVDDLSMDLNEKMNTVQERTAKIADLGLVKKAGESLTEKGRKLGIRGTTLYMAPESIRHEDYEPEADIWALGCTILELLTGKEPWKCDRNTERVTILFKIASTQEIPEIPSGFSEEAEDFLKKCLVRDPKSRWTADMLLGHPFVSAADGVFTRSIREERNIVVHPKAAQGILHSSFLSTFNLPKPYLLTSHSASNG
ncbi:mitogen-activated protein kinase kinase kinase 18-like [Camellia sinensis]|uniref:mitogen-activated protein kinase kinase kinase 18-like n=1 Tax=Camellia sinensis TaxID=4442 RepID=UPI001035C761|nr:mitogen-activated protein kinase kinase kinase 18-like [Camellia sinensis]